jgi:myo-inositol-1(or 4)-monophosphatase
MTLPIEALARHERVLPMADLSRASRIAEQAAYAAGTHLQASRSRLAAVVVMQKEPADVARAICDEAMGLIRDVVRRQFPDHGFAETHEADSLSAWDSSAHARPTFDPDQPHWVVDALDGRANYLRGYPQYAVSIALMQGDDPAIGVVYDPCRNEFFGAIRGRGAVLNGAAIRCAPPRETLSAFAATVFPKPADGVMAPYIAELGRVLHGFGGVRRSGSLALELAYLAAGRIDAFWAHGIDEQRAAAGMLLLRESGARVETRDDLPLPRSRTLIASTSGMREPLLSMLGGP